MSEKPLEWGPEEGILFHDPHAESGKIVVLAVVHAGHLRGLAAHQRATGLHTAFHDPGDDAFADAHIQFAHRKVVEKKQRFGALDHHVVDAHRHQIDSHRIVALGVDREPQLGTHTVGSRHEHGLSIAVEGYFDQGPEAAKSAQHLAAH